MNIYKRNITIKLWLLRILLVTVLLLCIYLIQHSNSDYAFVLCFLLLCGAIFPVTHLRIGLGHVSVRQFYVYGIFYRSWKFDQTNKVSLQPFEIVVSDAGVAGGDEWYDIFWLVVPHTDIAIKKFVFKYYDSWARLRRVKLTLNAKEIDALKKSLAVETIPIS